MIIKVYCFQLAGDVHFLRRIAFALYVVFIKLISSSNSSHSDLNTRL